MEQGVVKSETVSGQPVQTRGIVGVRLLRLVAMVMLVVVILLPRVLPFSPTFLTFDETAISNWTSEMTRALLAQDWPNTINNAYPAVTLMWIEAAQVEAAQWVPGWTKTAAEMVADSEENTFAALPRRRLALALLNSVLVVATYGLLRRLYNNFVAVIATLLIALDPFLLTQSRVFRTEGLTTGLMLVSALMIVLYARERREGWLIGSGVVAGLATLTKITSLYLLPFTGLTLLAWPLLEREQRLGRLVGGVVRGLVLWSGVMGITVFVLWPVLWVAPSTAFDKIYEYLSGAATDVNQVWGKGGSFFRGQPVTTDPGVPFYLWLMAFRTTPVVWAGLLAALAASLALLARSFITRWLAAPLLARSPVVPVDFSAATLLLFAYAVFYFIAMSLGAAKVDRYLMPIFPGLAIVAGAGLAWLVSFFSLQKGWLNQGAIWTGVLLGSAWFSLPHHPYYFTYWNPLLGGGRAAIKMVPVGSGEGVDVLIDYLNSLPNAVELKLSSTGQHQNCEMAFKGTYLKEAEFLDSDYFITVAPAIQRERPLANIDKLIPEIELVRTFSKGGVDYARLYRMPPGFHNAGNWLGSHGKLIGYGYSAKQVGAGDVLEVSVFWQNDLNGWTLGDSEFVIKLVDESGQTQELIPAHLMSGLEPYLSRPEQIVVFTGSFNVPPDISLGIYRLEIGLRLKETAEETWNFPLETPDSTITVKRGVLNPSRESLSISHPLDVTLGKSGLSLLGYDQEPGHLFLYWQSVQPGDEVYQYRLVLKDGRGQAVAWWSDRVGPALHPQAEWEPGEVVKVPVALEVSRAPAPGPYTGELEVLDEGGNRVGSTIELGMIDAGWLEAEPVVRYGLEPVGFGEGLDLIGYEVHGQGSGEVGALTVMLNWANQKPAAGGEVQVEVLGAGGEVLGQEVGILPGRLGLLTWQGVSEHRFVLQNWPEALVVRVRPPGTEGWNEVTRPGQPVADRLVIDNILEKIIVLSP